jgi:TPR repeat protein
MIESKYTEIEAEMTKTNTLQFNALSISCYKRESMRRVIILSFFLFSKLVLANDASQSCSEFVSAADNYKIAHQNEYCISAAKEGHGSALYSLGMAYGFDGKPDLELQYYEKAAEKNVIAAYLALGHVYLAKDKTKYIYWYKRFIATKTQGYGYASIKLARLNKEKGESKSSVYWLNVCKESPYSTNCVL